jgi:hypothetical protein
MYGEITWPLNCRYVLFLAVQMLLTSHYRLKRCLPTEAGCIVLFCSKSLGRTMSWEDNKLLVKAHPFGYNSGIKDCCC